MVLSNLNSILPTSKAKYSLRSNSKVSCGQSWQSRHCWEWSRVGRASFPQHLPTGKLQSRKDIWGSQLPEPAMDGPVALSGVAGLFCAALGIKWAVQDRWAGSYFSFLTYFYFFPLLRSTWSFQLAVQPQWPCRVSLHTSSEMLAVLISLDL